MESARTARAHPIGMGRFCNGNGVARWVGPDAAWCRMTAPMAGFPGKPRNPVRLARLWHFQYPFVGVRDQ